jgi:pyruvate kinase
MTLPASKTKLVCTIGPASDSPEIMEGMIRAGMNVARFNFSHGDFAGHGRAIRNLAAAAEGAGSPVAVLADLPGPKLRIGKLTHEPIELASGESLILTTDEILGDRERISVNFPNLPAIVVPGHTLFLNDGYIRLEVIRVEKKAIHCRVATGGELRSRKGLNLPGIDLGISAFTENDYRCMKFALENGADAISQSFVENAADIHAVREAARSLGYDPMIIAKIERLRALDHLKEIFNAADGIMIARGDLGVEVPIERMAVIQKDLVRKANAEGKPVITATQMLESMTRHPLPTRAEATDVANAVIDGTDCLMLSGETAMGRYPVESVSMLSRIASAAEPLQSGTAELKNPDPADGGGRMAVHDLLALSVKTAVRSVIPAAVIAPTQSGTTVRSLARFRLPLWITAVTPVHATCQNLLFSYGVFPVLVETYPQDWKAFARDWLRMHGIHGDLVVLAEGPSPESPEASYRMEIMEITRS